jgi:hypothetical protein
MAREPGDRRMRPEGLGRELTIAFALKVVAIAVIFAAFFTPAHRLRPTPADMAAFLTGGSGPAK